MTKQKTYSVTCMGITSFFYEYQNKCEGCNLMLSSPFHIGYLDTPAEQIKHFHMHNCPICKTEHEHNIIVEIDEIDRIKNLLTPKNSDLAGFDPLSPFILSMNEKGEISNNNGDTND